MKQVTNLAGQFRGMVTDLSGHSGLGFGRWLWWVLAEWWKFQVAGRSGRGCVTGSRKEVDAYGSLGRSGDGDVPGAEQHCKGDDAQDDTPTYAAPLFLNCRFEHGDCS